MKSVTERAQKQVRGRCLQTYRFRYTLYGTLFGILFPIVATIIDIVYGTHEFTVKGFLEAQSHQVLLWIIDTAPFFLGLFAYFIGKRQDDICTLNCILEEQIAGQSRELLRASEQIDLQLAELEETKHLYDENIKRLRSRLDQIYDIDSNNRGVSLTDLIQPERLQRLQDSFAKVFNMSSVIADPEGHPITQPSNTSRLCKQVWSTEAGRHMCLKSNQDLGYQAARLMQPSIKKCEKCSLLDAGAPIVVEGRHIGTWIIGQNPVGSLNKQALTKHAQEIGVDVAELEDAYNELPRIPLNKFEQIVELLWHFASEISSLAFSNLELARELAQKKDISLNESTGIVIGKKNF